MNMFVLEEFPLQSLMLLLFFFVSWLTLNISLVLFVTILIKMQLLFIKLNMFNLNREEYHECN